MPEPSEKEPDGVEIKLTSDDKIKYDAEELTFLAETALESGETLVLAEADLRGLDLRGIFPPDIKISLSDWGRNREGRIMRRIAQIDESTQVDDIFLNAVIDDKPPTIIRTMRNQQNPNITQDVTAPEGKVPTETKTVEEEKKSIEPLALIEKSPGSPDIQGLGLAIQLPNERKALLSLNPIPGSNDGSGRTVLGFRGTATVSLKILCQAEEPGDFYPIPMTLSAPRGRGSHKGPFSSEDLDNCTISYHPLLTGSIKDAIRKVFNNTITPADLKEIMQVTITTYFDKLLSDQKNIPRTGSLLQLDEADLLDINEEVEPTQPDSRVQVVYDSGGYIKEQLLLDNGTIAGRVYSPKHTGNIIVELIGKSGEPMSRSFTNVKTAEQYINKKPHLQGITLSVSAPKVVGTEIIDCWGQPVNVFHTSRDLRRELRSAIENYSEQKEQERLKIFTEDPSLWKLSVYISEDSNVYVYADRQGGERFIVMNDSNYNPSRWPQWVTDWIQSELGTITPGKRSNYYDYEEGEGDYTGFGHSALDRK